MQPGPHAADLQPNGYSIVKEPAWRGRRACGGRTWRTPRPHPKHRALYHIPSEKSSKKFRNDCKLLSGRYFRQFIYRPKSSPGTTRSAFRAGSLRVKGTASLGSAGASPSPCVYTDLKMALIQQKSRHECTDGAEGTDNEFAPASFFFPSSASGVLPWRTFFVRGT